LGEALAEAGRKDAAIAAFRHYLHLDPADSMGGAVQLALLGADAIPEAMTPAFIRRLFDNYADHFDEALVNTLRYVGPQALRNAVETAAPGRRFTRMLDLGCGTGLAGLAFRSLVERLDGVDLSPRMVAQANAKEIYDTAVVGDVVTHLRGCAGAYDLVIAADVLVYFGALDEVFRAAHGALQPDGIFAFTVQASSGDGFTLGEERRFSHSRNYLTAHAGEAGFRSVVMSDGTFRQNRGLDVPGLLAVLRKSK
jgi:predicted TPR repeat methyltransferase